MSDQAVAVPTWRVTSSSRKGSSHGDESPNQDAVQFASVKNGTDADVWVAAVSDGHGGRRYVRSDVGSAMAVGVAVTHLAEVIRQEAGPVAFEQLLRTEVPAIVGAWRDGVLAHLRAHPFTEAEAERAGSPLDDDPVVAYGATLLIVVVGEEGVGLAQIGDGDALIRTHGFATRPVPGDPRLVAGETTSLCLDSAVTDFRYAALPGSADADLILLSSDGYANSFADHDWWRAVVGDLAWFLDDHGFDEFAEQFPAWLGESAVVGGDDVSAVVIARSPLVVPPGDASGPVVVLPASGQPEGDVDLPLSDPAALTAVSLSEVDPQDGPAHAFELVGAAPVTPAPRRRRRLVLLAMGLVLAAGLAAAWLVTGGLGSGGGPAGPTPSQPPTHSRSTKPGGTQPHHTHHGGHQGSPRGHANPPGQSGASRG